MKKVLAGICALFMVFFVMFLTFQSPEDTVNLSETVRGFVTSLGYHGDRFQIRSDVHLVMYFVVGFVIILFFMIMEWQRIFGVLAACLFGIFDEVIKIFLPTREFDGIDLIKDFIGVGIAYLILIILERCIRGKKK